MPTGESPFDWSEVRSSAIGSPKQMWPDEERDLTPWVVDHLDELGGKLGLQLTFVERESQVGTFRADILAVDERGRKVIIENQFGPTDHMHFGQIVLYGLETRASVVVWLATFSFPYGFRLEHRSAVRRLNEVFGPEISFCGVELSVESEGVPLGEPDGPLLQVLTVVVAPEQ